MSQGFLMGLDVGGSGGRCLLIGLESGEITTAFRPWTHRPTPHTGGWGFDLDVERVWRVLGETARETLDRARVNPGRVFALAVTSMRFGMVLLGTDGQALLAVPNRDARAASEAMELARQRGDEFYQRTGHWPSPIFAGVRLVWLAQQMPESLKQAHALLSLSDWVAFRLTGAVAAELSHAGETLLFDVKTSSWADDLIASLDLPRAIFPPLVAAGTNLGPLKEAVAAHLGLMPGLPVAAGGADTQSGLLGAGVVSPGQLGVIAGTTAPVQLVTSRPIVDPQRRLWAGVHIVPGLWVLESNAGGTGKALEWFAQMLCPDAPDAVAMLIAEAATSQPGASGMVSTLGVTVFNASQMGLPVDGLTMTHEVAGGDNGRSDRAHLARAVLEGLAYSVRANAAQALEVAGTDVSAVHLSGGMSRSGFWSQLLSDVMNVPVDLPVTPEASALGAAICAGVGAAVFDNLAEGARGLDRVARRCTPAPETARIYQGLYADWNDVRAARAEADLLLSSQLVEVLASKSASKNVMIDTPAFRPRILVTADMDVAALDALREMGNVEYASYREVMRLLTGDELVEALQGVHVFITEVDVVDAEALAQLPDLRVVAVCRGNPVNVDISACTALGIPIVHTPGRNADAVADLAVAYMLMLARTLLEATVFLREPGGEAGDMGRMGMAHSQFQGRELWGKTVGLVGLGAIGRKTAQRLLPFGARILAYDPYVTPEQAMLSGAEKASFEALLAESDFISLHAPATDETRGMIGAQAFARMKPGAYLINTARAALIDDAALLEALGSGHLGGVALDVFSVEPPGPDDPLLAFPNVIATPHLGGNTHEVAAHQGQIAVDELRRLLRGETPHHVCNPEVLANFSWTAPRTTLSAEVVRQLAVGPGPAVSDLEVETKAERAAQVHSVTTPEPEQRRGGVLSGLRKVLGGEKEPAPPDVPAALAGNVREYMTRILQSFVDKVSADKALRAFSKGKGVTMYFIVTDLDLDFFFDFQDGMVTGALGPPAGDADVTLKMKADILDGIFTGRVSGTRAALSGKLSFKGDTSKAMAFQRIQKPLSQLYSAAREEIGDPGDLTRIDGAESTPQPALHTSATDTAALSTVSQGVQVVVRRGDVRDDILEVLNQLYARGWITGTGGNISARVDGMEDQVWITPARIFKGNLRADMMVRIDLDGSLLDPDALTPSSEWRFHCAIYRARSDINAVVHTHAPQATILGLTGKPFLPISTEAAFIGELPCVPFIMPGTRELADAVAGAMARGVAAIMQNHGLVVGGSSLRRAADMTEIIEVTAEKILTCYMLGQEPPVLPDEVVAALREIGEMMV
jgi:sugar (pentulose or hexulose) kinase/phosphoglycerate dehydrogenase-like enzyme/ribulose-5-phosphate 4-epimerase/fuculose-1-phosphate aldolase/putative sterol carrier protein